MPEGTSPRRQTEICMVYVPYIFSTTRHDSVRGQLVWYLEASFQTPEKFNEHSFFIVTSTLCIFDDKVCVRMIYVLHTTLPGCLDPRSGISVLLVKHGHSFSGIVAQEDCYRRRRVSWIFRRLIRVTRGHVSDSWTQNLIPILLLYLVTRII